MSLRFFHCTSAISTRCAKSPFQVSDPTSSLYGRYLSADDIRELTEPDPAHIAALGGWLDAAGVSWTRQGEVVEVQLTVNSACVLLRTRV